MNWQRNTNPPLYNICKLNLLFYLPLEISVPPCFCFIFLIFITFIPNFRFFFSPFSPSSEPPPFSLPSFYPEPIPFSTPFVPFQGPLSSLTPGTLCVPHSPLRTPVCCSQLSATEKASQNGRTDAWWKEEHVSCWKCWGGGTAVGTSKHRDLFPAKLWLQNFCWEDMHFLNENAMSKAPFPISKTRDQGSQRSQPA